MQDWRTALAVCIISELEFATSVSPSNLDLSVSIRKSVLSSRITTETEGIEMTATEAYRLPKSIAERLRIPAIAAPMFRVSGPELVSAICKAGVAAALPAVNARTPAVLDNWLDDIATATSASATIPAPHCVNLVMSHHMLHDHLACIINNRVEIVITSVGSPAPVLQALHAADVLVFSDVATIAHARKAALAGADGLVLLSAGAGGQTGWLNPFAFVRAVRGFFDGPIALAGGLSDGVALHAALSLGADLGYMGTRFIAAEESLASQRYREHVVNCDSDDVMLTSAFTGLPASWLRPAVLAAGLDPQSLDEQVTPEISNAVYGGGNDAAGPRRWTDVVSAGHSVSGVSAIEPASHIIDRIAREFFSANGTPIL